MLLALTAGTLYGLFKFMIRRPFPLLWLALLSLPLTARAVIIPGPNGLANTSESSLDTWTGGNAKPTFSYWDNVVRVSDASGVYLGASGSYGWVLTAAHVTPLTVGSGSISVDGTSYIVRDSVQIGQQDLRLYRIGGETGDSALPALSNLPIASTTPSIGTFVLDFGAGTRVESTSNSATDTDIGNAPGPVGDNFYEWAGATALRWGTNTTADAAPLAGLAVPIPPQTTITANLNDSIKNTKIFVSTFDTPATGTNLTTTEAALGVGDSGGPVFTVKSGAWQLSGINVYAISENNNDAANAFGDYSGYVNLADYRTSIIAAMVPEPSSTLLAAPLLAAVGFRRRRR